MIGPMYIHFIVALIVVAALIVGVITPLGRRVALWALALQLLIGLWLIFVGYRPSPWHPVLWLFAAVLTQAAILSGRRDRRAAALLLSVLALASAIGAFYLGVLGQRRPVSLPAAGPSKILAGRTHALSAALEPSAPQSDGSQVRFAKSSPSG